jgi:arylsulfatase A-like enzyme
VVEELCQLFDLGPTVLELAGVEPDETMAAESLVPALDDNLWNDPDVQNKKQDLLTRMLEWRIETGLQSGDWAAEFR